MTAKMHPLEGKYIIYLYGVQDSVDQNWALALFRLNKGIMKDVYHPSDNLLAGDLSSIGEENNEQLLRIMKKKRIKEVYTVRHSGDFFGIPGGWYETSGLLDEDGDIEEWAEYRSLRNEDEEYTLLEENGIKVNFYEENAIKRLTQ